MNKRGEVLKVVEKESNSFRNKCDDAITGLKKNDHAITNAEDMLTSADAELSTDKLSTLRKLVDKLSPGAPVKAEIRDAILREVEALERMKRMLENRVNTAKSLLLGCKGKQATVADHLNDLRIRAEEFRQKITEEVSGKRPADVSNFGKFTYIVKRAEISADNPFNSTSGSTESSKATTGERKKRRRVK